MEAKVEEHKITVEEAIANKIQVLREFKVVNRKNEKETVDILKQAIKNHPGRDIEIVLDQAAFDIIHQRFDDTLEEQAASTKVLVVETGKVYDSVRKCAQVLGIDRNGIRRCLNGRLKNYKGYHFKYVD